MLVTTNEDTHGAGLRNSIKRLCTRVVCMPLVWVRMWFGARDPAWLGSVPARQKIEASLGRQRPALSQPEAYARASTERRAG